MSKTQSSFSALVRLLRYARGHRRSIIVASTYSILNKLFDIMPEILIGMAIDVVVRQDQSFMADLGIAEPFHQMLALGALTVGVWAFESLFEFLLLVTWRNLAQRLQHDLRMDAYGHLQDLDMAWFEDASTGKLVAILNDDVNQLERFLNGGASDLIQVGVTVVSVGAVFFYLSPPIALMAFTPIPVIIIGAFWFQRRAQPLYAEVRERVGFLSTRLANNISGIATIKSFTRESHELDRLGEDSEAYVEANRRAIRISSAFIPIIRMAIMAGFVATLVYGGKLVLDGELNAGAYSVLVFLTQRLLWPLTRMAETIDLYERAMASTRRILDLVETPIRVRPGEQPLPVDGVRGDIRFEKVGFAYGDGPAVLSDVDIDLPAGETLALVGSTGSGKSTLVKLLLRFYEPTAGRITLDGHDLNGVILHDLRASIGFVSQDVFLFHGTVRENIAYGQPDAGDDAIEAAARAAEAHDFIMTLPQGYDTLVGERGQKLSGGQRQRLSIARAVLKDPPVLILDEATSAVDNETEAAIQRSMKRVAEGRTTVVIAHRLSTIVDADRICVLDSGRIVETGRHDELIRRGGIYQGLWDVQTGSAGD
ncbi:ABC transporter ATP-binding protein [Marinihelvus fidelis]|uniref:ABC transporter ATP-binding protein n=1 Tax=Marinihelvus fidelis TaxID=2613842 RepID=A0A5N0T4E2_9GAMM|nr:ABC transporter ATP-binding protein [Marinihelvus fidelis]KAA9129773.1 ABC transporter ATP-binding protein [Marinihelvus fidelis]